MSSGFGLARAGYGAVLVLVPARVARLYSGPHPDRLATAIVRVLGARQVVQGLLSTGDPGPAVLALGAEVDVAHAISMVGLAAMDRDRRRGGLVDALVAGCFAVVSVVLARRAAQAQGAQALRPVSDEPVAALAGAREGLANRLVRLVLPGPARRALVGGS